MSSRVNGRSGNLTYLHLSELYGSQIRAAHSLTSIIHSMKLLLLLSDESQIASRRDAEMRDVQAEKDVLKKQVAQKLDEILHPERTKAQSGGQ